MSAYGRVQDLIQIILDAVSQEVQTHIKREREAHTPKNNNWEDRVYSRTPRRQAPPPIAPVGPVDLSVEIESVITRGVLEALKRGGDPHEKDTEPPPPGRSVPPRASFPSRPPTPAGPVPTIPPNITKRPTPPYGRPSIPTPIPRGRRDFRRDED